MKMKEWYLMNKLHLMLNMKVKKERRSLRKRKWENDICVPFGMIHKIRFSHWMWWFTNHMLSFFHRCLHSIKKSKRMQKKIRRSTILKQRKKILEIIIIVFSEDKTSAFLFISSYPKDIVVLNHKEYVISVGSKRNQNISTHFWIRG